MDTSVSSIASPTLPQESQAAPALITQRDYACAGLITPAMEAVAQEEHYPVEAIREAVAAGCLAIPGNIHHGRLKPCGVGTLVDGRSLSTKVNVNLGISGDQADEAAEWEKVAVAERLGADAIMDLSNSGKTRPFRRQLIESSPLMIGTVPLYDAIGHCEKPLIALTPQDFLGTVRAHAEDGVDFVTIHAGMNRQVIRHLKETGRLTQVVSRGGSLIFAWMEATGQENPFYEYFDEVLDILHAHDVTISLGDALRPGSGYDATDAAQIGELIELGKLTQRAWDKGVSVLVEGPGHMALDEIAANMLLEKRLCHRAPFYVLGPLVTDIAPGYDHITAAIGGAVAAMNGADFLCYVTTAEHLHLPTVADVEEGLVATKIAAHAADIAKKVPQARDRDNAMSDARRRVDWEGMTAQAIHPQRVQERLAERPPAHEGTCTMCGTMCAMKTVNEIMEGLTVDLGFDEPKTPPHRRWDTQAICDGLALYAVTDSRWLKGRRLYDCVREALEGGATMVQLREKEGSTEELVELAQALKPLCAAYGVPLLIDDDVEAARLAGVDGVHVGQSDVACAQARQILGPDAIIGVSAQSVAMAKAAEEAGADYLGVGAVFSTNTKDAPVISVDTLQDITDAVAIPVVAIGGITQENLGELKGTGIKGVAVVSAIFAAPSITEATVTLRQVVREKLGC